MAFLPSGTDVVVLTGDGEWRPYTTQRDLAFDNADLVDLIRIVYQEYKVPEEVFARLRSERFEVAAIVDGVWLSTFMNNFNNIDLS